jgi:hypothetical protein
MPLILFLHLNGVLGFWGFGALIVESCVDGKTFKVGSGFDDN